MYRQALLIIGLSLMFVSAAAEEVVARMGDAQVTAEDIERYVLMHRGAEELADNLAQPQAIDRYIQDLLMMRTLAQQASQQDLGPEQEQMAWQLDYQRQTWLVEALQAHIVAEAMADVDWEAWAKETYLAESDQYTGNPQVDAAHILIMTEGRSDEEAKALIEEIHAQVLAGEDFNKLAKQYSDDPSAKENGGELGAFDRYKMVPPFSSAAFALKEPGDISDPVKTRFGYHIIKLNKKVAAGKHPFATVKKTIIEKLQKKVASDTVSQLLAPLRTQAASVERNIDAINKLREKHGLEPITSSSNVE